MNTKTRRAVRLDSAGELVLITEQDRARLDQAKFREGRTVVDAALALQDPGPYPVQAALSALRAITPCGNYAERAYLQRQLNIIFDLGM
jgi:RNA polymerase sigma-70 factor (ECF subfamily)